MSVPGFVIIGTGEAGVRAATSLRERGFEGSITLIGDETHAPYERPPLSKHSMHEGDAPSLKIITDPSRLEELGIEVILGVGASEIDAIGHAVKLEDGRRVPYSKLLLATGARARRLSVPGAGPENVLYLRTFGDALKLRPRLASTQRLVIIGGGFIGLELAASAVALGCQVIVVEAAVRVLGRAVPESIARQISQRHIDAGVTFITGVPLVSIGRDRDLEIVTLSDGRKIVCDTIVAGVGAEPEIALAQSCGLSIDNGIAVDDRLVTSDPDILAAGDCCSFPHPLFGGRRMRLEAWRNAQDQGAHAAAVMMGDTSPFSVVPWFWSDQYDMTLQIAGIPSEGSKTIERALNDTTTMYFHLKDDGRLVGVSAFGNNGVIAKEIRVGEMLIQRGHVADTAVLSNPASKLKALLAA